MLYRGYKCTFFFPLTLQVYPPTVHFKFTGRQKNISSILQEMGQTVSRDSQTPIPNPKLTLLFLQCIPPIWVFLKNWGTIVGVPIIRTIVYWDLCWGPPILGNCHMLHKAVKHENHTSSLNHVFVGLHLMNFKHLIPSPEQSYRNLYYSCHYPNPKHLVLSL